jgi:hypothetical protein
MCGGGGTEVVSSGAMLSASSLAFAISSLEEYCELALSVENPAEHIDFSFCKNRVMYVQDRAQAAGISREENGAV